VVSEQAQRLSFTSCSCASLCFKTAVIKGDQIKQS
jgi:hypothetical protein